MALIKNTEQIRGIRKLAGELSELLAFSIDLLQPGFSTQEIDLQIEKKMEAMGVRGPCKGYHGYPAVSCISVNEQVTHGIPDDTVLANGDIVDIDLVIERDGLFADMSRTTGVGNISNEASKLIKATENCLKKGLQAAVNGNTLGDVGYAIQNHAERNGYSIVREYCGHFIGTSMHEEPLVLNYGRKGKGLKLEPGMILCIEPMLNQGTHRIVSNGWDVRTQDGELSSRCEHMVLITKKGNEILTRFPD